MQEQPVIQVQSTQSREATILAVPRTAFSGFVEFLRERGVTGLAIGFVLGTQVQRVVNALLADLITPAISIIAGRADNIAQFTVGPFQIGDFIFNLIDFLLLVLVIYAIFKMLRLDRLDKPKE